MHVAGGNHTDAPSVAAQRETAVEEPTIVSAAQGVEPRLVHAMLHVLHQQNVAPSVAVAAGDVKCLRPQPYSQVLAESRLCGLSGIEARAAASESSFQDYEFPPRPKCGTACFSLLFSPVFLPFFFCFFWAWPSTPAHECLSFCGL